MSNIQDEYTRWQDGFNAAYRIEPNKEAFRRKMAEYHPGIDPDLSEEKQLSKIKERMRNATRGLKDENGETVHYDRSPYLEDLFALCKAKGLSPNDILLGSQFVLASSFLSFVDIYDLLKSTNLGNDLFECFDISKQDFYGHKSFPDDPIFLILFRKNIIFRFSKMFIISSKIKGIQNKEISFESEIEDGVQADEHLELIRNLKVWLANQLNDTMLNYLYLDEEFRELCSSAFWIYDVDETKFKHGNFDGIDLQYSKSWCRKSHFMATVHFILFDCFVVTLEELYKLGIPLNEKQQPSSSLQYCQNYISNSEQAMEFCIQLHLKSYIAINQSTIIDTRGYLRVRTDEEDEKDDEFRSTQTETPYKKRTDDNVPKKGCVPPIKSSSSVM